MKHLQRSLIVVACLLMTVVTSLAGPANPEPTEFTQPDGSKITIRLQGDEFQNWTELVDTGHTIIRNNSTGFWEYAEQNYDGTLKGSGVTVQPKGLNSPANIPKGLRPPRNKDAQQQMNLMLQDMYQQRFTGNQMMILPDGSFAAAGDWVPTPVSGSRKILLVLVGFADRTFVTTPASWYTAVFDSTAKSVTKYYKDNSFATLNITPVSHTQPGMPAGVVAVTLPTNHPNLGSSPTFASDQAWGNSTLALAASYVNFNALDTNSDGILDPSEVVIYFIVAGYEASAGSGLTPAVWAHAWRTSGTGLTVGTKNVRRWSQSGEYYNASTQMPMGVIAHEMGHQMAGLPDLYDISGQNQGMGSFSLMAGGSWGGDYIGDVYETGSTTPTALDAWSREFLGWTTPVTLTTAGTVSLPLPLSANNAALKLILPATSTTEYFLAENRYPTGWDLGMKRLLGNTWAGGLLLTHIDITAGTLGSNDINSYTVNSTTPGHQGVVPVQASTATCNMLNVGSPCRGHETTLFYKGNNNIWGASSTPNSNYYSGARTAMELNTISLPASTMTAILKLNVPINGTCGSSHNQAFSSAPATGLCSAGTPSAVSGGGPWKWSCAETPGGTTISCLAYATSQQVTVMPFPQNFDTVAAPALPSGWTSNVSSGSGGVWRTNNGTVNPSGTAAHSPSNLVFFNSWTANTGSAAYLASPAFSLAGKSGGKVSFWMYHDTQYNRYTDRIDVYVNTASTLSGASLLGSVYRYVWSAGWVQHNFDIPDIFTGATNYLLINGVSAYGNDMHLDDINVSAFTPAYYKLTFNFAGAGYGSVNSAPTGISCTGTTGSVCAPNYFASGSVVLTASPDSSSSNHSTFTGWTPACNSTGSCTVPLSGPTTVSGNFNRDKLVKFSTQGSGTYGTIAEALGAATSGQTIQVRDNSGLTVFTEPLNINKSITLIGGFSAGFASSSGYTASTNVLTIGNGGVLKVKRFIIRQ